MTCVYVIAMSCERFCRRMTVTSNCLRKFVLISTFIFTLLVTTSGILREKNSGILLEISKPPFISIFSCVFLSPSHLY